MKKKQKSLSKEQKKATLAEIRATLALSLNPLAEKFGGKEGVLPKAIEKELKKFAHRIADKLKPKATDEAAVEGQAEPAKPAKKSTKSKKVAAVD